MRRRQISNMHGGYRGSGVTIDWHTTKNKPSFIQVEDKPLPPIINPNIPEPIPFPTTPSTPSQPRKTNYTNILGLVGLTGSIAAGAVGAYHLYSKSSQPANSGIIEEGAPLLREAGDGLGQIPDVAVGRRKARSCKRFFELSEEEQERWCPGDPECELQLSPDPLQALKDRRQECADLGFMRSLGPSYFENI